MEKTKKNYRKQLYKKLFEKDFKNSLKPHYSYDEFQFDVQDPDYSFLSHPVSDKVPLENNPNEQK